MCAGEVESIGPKWYFSSSKIIKGDAVLEDFITKSYLHFDYRTRYSTVKDYVENPLWIVKHGFFPFIHKSNIQVKYQENGTNNRPIKIKPRELYRASHLDSCIYKYYAAKLSERYDDEVAFRKIDENVAAYRTGKGKSNIDYAAEIINFIKEKEEGCFVFLGDFEKFFDTLDHDYLKCKIEELQKVEKLPDDWYKIFKSITKFSWVEQSDLNDIFGPEREQYRKGLKTYFESWDDFRRFKNAGHIKRNEKGFGIPQGTPISALLSNIYMMDFDSWLNDMSSKYKGKYLRYADDFVLILPFETTTEQDFRNIVAKVFKYAVDETKLTIEQRKTEQYFFKEDKVYLFESDKGVTRSIIESKIDYLGFVFDGKIVRMRQKSVSKFYRKADKAIQIAKKNTRTKNANHLIGKRHIYRYFFDIGERDNRGSKFGNFISYAKRCQVIFDEVSPLTNNLMLDQIKNRRKKLLRKMSIDR